MTKRLLYRGVLYVSAAKKNHPDYKWYVVKWDGIKIMGGWKTKEEAVEFWKQQKVPCAVASLTELRSERSVLNPDNDASWL